MVLNATVWQPLRKVHRGNTHTSSGDQTSADSLQALNLHPAIHQSQSKETMSFHSQWFYRDEPWIFLARHLNFCVTHTPLSMILSQRVAFFPSSPSSPFPSFTRSNFKSGCLTTSIPHDTLYYTRACRKPNIKQSHYTSYINRLEQALSGRWRPLNRKAFSKLQWVSSLQWVQSRTAECQRLSWIFILN